MYASHITRFTRYEPWHAPGFGFTLHVSRITIFGTPIIKSKDLTQLFLHLK